MNARAQTSKDRAKRRDHLQALLRKIEDAVHPVLVGDMTDVATEMVRIGIMQMFDSKQTALRYLDALYTRMAERIDDDFDDYKRNHKGDLH
jgi:hypothetical protein